MHIIEHNDVNKKMMMEVLLKEAENNAKLTIIFKNIPTGINPKDNKDGTEQSLEKLAAY